MTKQTDITAATAVDAGNQKVRLADTYVSEHNPRFYEELDHDSIQGLAETIIASGLLQNLCGLVDADGKVGIVAGRRRWHALQIAAEERPDLEVIDVKVTDDLHTALGWAMLENMQREEMDAVDEIRAYASSLASGLTVPQVAKAYCVTEPHVYRRAALGKLPGPVLDALKAGDISMSDAQAFTVSDDEARQLAVLEAMESNQWWGSYQIKDALNDDKPDADGRVARFVGLDAYQEAGDEIDRNLFDDDITIADPGILVDLFDKKLATAADVFQKAEQLAWVETRDDAQVMTHDLVSDGSFVKMDPTPGTLTEEQQARLEELSKGQWWTLEDDEKAEKKALEDIRRGEYSAAQRAMMGAVVYVPEMPR